MRDGPGISFLEKKGVYMRGEGGKMAAL